MLSLEAGGQNPVLALLAAPGLPALPDSGFITPISASVFIWASLVCLCVKTASVSLHAVASRAHLDNPEQVPLFRNLNSSLCEVR